MLLVIHSPLKPDELQVLRAQYEKEGEYVGVQTKFNYAWVRSGVCTLTTALKLAKRDSSNHLVGESNKRASDFCPKYFAMPLNEDESACIILR